MIALCLVPTTFAAEGDLFNDVNDGTKHYEAIKYVKENNVVEGYEAVEKVLKNVPETLVDVRGAWYEKYLLPTEYYALMLDGRSSFGQEVTRGKMAEIVYRADMLMKEEVVMDRPGDWEIVKDYVTTKYPVSVEYFDAHFSYVDSTINNKILDWKNFLGGRGSNPLRSAIKNHNLAQR